MILSGHADVVREDSDGIIEKLNQIGPGDFFGEEGLAAGHPPNASVVAVDGVTCLVFSPAESTPFAGRGKEVQHATTTEHMNIEEMGAGATTCIDVSGYVMQKMAAIATHQTQFPISLDIFPQVTLQEMLGREYFVRIYPTE